MIHHTCFKCKRHFELDPVFVGFELSKLKKKSPKYYQAVCPACRAVNKVSVKAMQADLDEVADEVEKMSTEYQEKLAKEKADKKAAKNAKRREENFEERLTFPFLCVLRG